MKSIKKELKAYQTPQVTDYGNIKQITMSLGKRGRTDGGSVKNFKNSQVG